MSERPQNKHLKPQKPGQSGNPRGRPPKKKPTLSDHIFSPSSKPKPGRHSGSHKDKGNG